MNQKFLLHLAEMRASQFCICGADVVIISESHKSKDSGLKIQNFVFNTV